MKKQKNKSFKYGFTLTLFNNCFGGLYETSLSEYVGSILIFLNREKNHHLWLKFTEQNESQFEFNTTHAKGLVQVESHIQKNTQKINHKTFVFLTVSFIY